MSKRTPLSEGRFDILMGSLCDPDIAWLAGCTKSAVQLRRRSLKIPAGRRKRGRSGGRTPVLPEYTDEQLAEALGVPQGKIHEVRQTRKTTILERLRSITEEDLRRFSSEELALQYDTDVRTVRAHVCARFGAGANLRWIPDEQILLGRLEDVAEKFGVCLNSIQSERVRRRGHVGRRNPCREQ